MRVPQREGIADGVRDFMAGQVYIAVRVLPGRHGQVRVHQGPFPAVRERGAQADMDPRVIDEIVADVAGIG